MREATKSMTGLSMSAVPFILLILSLLPSFILIKIISSTAVLSKKGIQTVFRILSRVKINEIRPLNLSLHGISFYGLDAEDGFERGRISSVSDIYVSFRIPTLYNPYFATLHLKGIRHFGPLGSGQCCTLIVRIRLPRRDQTWIRLRIEDMRVTVRDVVPPMVVDRLRENLLRTVFLGEVERLNELVVRVDSSMIWSGEGVSAFAKARGYEVNILGRTYDFGTLKADLLRRWCNGHGRFSIYASNLLWRKNDVDESLGWKNLKTIDFFFYPITLISSLSSAIQRPASLFDIEVTSGELKFRKFRHRDQALLKRGLQYTGEWKPQVLDPEFLNNILYETIADFIAPSDDIENNSEEHVDSTNDNAIRT